MYIVARNYPSTYRWWLKCDVITMIQYYKGICLCVLESRVKRHLLDELVLLLTLSVSSEIKVKSKQNYDLTLTNFRAVCNCGVQATPCRGQTRMCRDIARPTGG